MQSMHRCLWESRNATYAICTNVHYGRNTRIIQARGYGYEFVDKAIAENYNKSAVNAQTAGALVITS